VVSWGALTRRVLEAAETLAGAGVEADVVELTWLNPVDLDAVVRSLERTRRLVVVHEANVTGGFGAEVVARVVETGIDLDARPLRIGTPDVRMPAAPGLASALVPTADRIAAEVDALVRGDRTALEHA
jgi:pyruvate/2-oxoglutarate/acetoin dehydrogenase E1 component